MVANNMFSTSESLCADPETWSCMSASHDILLAASAKPSLPFVKWIFLRQDPGSLAVGVRADIDAVRLGGSHFSNTNDINTKGKFC